MRRSAPARHISEECSRVHVYYPHYVLAALETRLQRKSVARSLRRLKAPVFSAKTNVPWVVRNMNQYSGWITLREALKHSDNTAFARLTEMLNAQDLFSCMKDFIFAISDTHRPLFVLGGHKTGVNLLSLAAAYLAIARDGVYSHPRLIRHVECFDDVYSNGIAVRSPGYGSAGNYAAVRGRWCFAFAASKVVGIRFSGKTGTTSAGALAGYNDAAAAAIWLVIEHPWRKAIIKQSPRPMRSKR